MKKISNNKGISLISVLVTVILMLIILSSIIFSNSRTKEIQKTMLLNSDIEELNDKVRVYYLKHETIPIDRNEKFSYYVDEDSDGKAGPTEPTYYRLSVSSFDNLTLNNLEILNDHPNAELSWEDKQWYVINPETHLIYFVKHEENEETGEYEKKLQEAKYSKKYDSIIAKAIASGIKFNKEADSQDQIENTNILQTKVTPYVKEDTTE